MCVVVVVYLSVVSFGCVMVVSVLVCYLILSIVLLCRFYLVLIGGEMFLRLGLGICLFFFGFGLFSWSL